MENIFNFVVQSLVKAGIESPRLEARILIAEVLHCRPEDVYDGINISAEARQKIINMLKQRLQHMPLDKIIGHKEFYKYDFWVNENVLSPRPDTEILLEKALTLAQNNSAKKLLDLGTGSGCLIISLLKELPTTQGVAVDISNQAIAVAQQNAINLQVSDRLQFVNADWFAADFVKKIGQEFEIIVSNPPYIPRSDIKDLAPEVKDFDPMLALDGGNSGYDSYEKIAELAPQLLTDNGYILLEAGVGQAPKIADIFTKHVLRLVDIVKDLSGIERCVILQKVVA